MVIGIIGESCVGKSTLAEALGEHFSSDIYTGKDYLRLSKNELEAKEKFKQLLGEKKQSGNVIYVISEKEHLALLPDGAIRIVMTAGIELIKERFKQRMHGNLPAPVALMLEKKHGSFDNEPCDIKLTSDEYQIEAVIAEIEKF